MIVNMLLILDMSKEPVHFLVAALKTPEVTNVINVGS